MSSATPPIFTPPPSPTPTGQAEASALTKVMWFGILQLVGLVSGWMVTFFFIGINFSNLSPANLGPNPTPAEVRAVLGPVFANLTLLVPILAVVQIAAIIALLLGLRQLKGVDGRFSVPSILTMLLLAGAVIAILGVVPLFNLLPSLIAQASSATGTTVPAGLISAVASLVIYFFLIAIGGILGLIGLIGGQILGLWRVGSKYGETILKLGAIFAIIPLLNIIAPVLVIVGAFQARGRVSAQM